MSQKLLRRVALLGAAGAIGVAAAVVVVRWHPWDPRMSAQDVERALAVRYRARQAGNSPGKVTFHCKRLENDGTIQLHDVDYKCDAVGADFGYWVGTDSHRITEIQAYF